MNNKVYLLNNVENYGKFIAYCIEHDICVFRTYWDEKEKSDRCFRIDWQEKRCYYSSKDYFENLGFEIVVPDFSISYGSYKLG